MKLFNGAIFLIFCVTSVVYCDLNTKDKQEIKNLVKLLFKQYVNEARVKIVPFSVIDVPNKCPPGSAADENGDCQEIWDSLSVKSKIITVPNTNIPSDSVIDVPDKCPPGFSADEHGKCQEIWDSIINENENIINPGGVIEVPDKCPPGYKPDEHGNCQEEWDRKHYDNILYKILHTNGNILDKNQNGNSVSPNGVIDVPDKCPPGYKPDEHGDCQEEWGSLINKKQSETSKNPNIVI